MAHRMLATQYRVDLGEGVFLVHMRPASGNTKAVWGFVLAHHAGAKMDIPGCREPAWGAI